MSRRKAFVARRRVAPAAAEAARVEAVAGSLVPEPAHGLSPPEASSLAGPAPVDPSGEVHAQLHPQPQQLAQQQEQQQQKQEKQEPHRVQKQNQRLAQTQHPI